MFSSPPILLLIVAASGIFGTIYFEHGAELGAIGIVKSHMSEVVKACDAENETAFLQLISVGHQFPNKTLAMAIWGSYEYTVTEAEWFNNGDIYTTVDMKKPGKEMYLYLFLRKAKPSPSGWTIYNVG